MTHQNCKIKYVYKTSFHKSGHIYIASNSACITELTFIALPLVSMGSNNAASDAITVMMMNKLIVTIVL